MAPSSFAGTPTGRRNDSNYCQHQNRCSEGPNLGSQKAQATEFDT